MKQEPFTEYGADIHFWYGTKEAFVAKPQAEHLLKLCPSAHVEVFKGMNHGQMLVDHPDEVSRRIILTQSRNEVSGNDLNASF
ncbi:MAG: hypothetical protein J6T18_07750 [Bacteroidaceae bacterium]|nr:hypothetical protein [Bacteroidaceae bacterium]